MLAVLLNGRDGRFERIKYFVGSDVNTSTDAHAPSSARVPRNLARISSLAPSDFDCARRLNCPLPATSYNPPCKNIFQQEFRSDVSNCKLNFGRLFAPPRLRVLSVRVKTPPVAMRNRAEFVRGNAFSVQDRERELFCGSAGLTSVLLFASLDHSPVFKHRCRECHKE